MNSGSSAFIFAGGQSGADGSCLVVPDVAVGVPLDLAGRCAAPQHLFDRTSLRWAISMARLVVVLQR
jgi:hypothetical protein